MTSQRSHLCVPSLWKVKDSTYELWKDSYHNTVDKEKVSKAAREKNKHNTQTDKQKSERRFFIKTNALQNAMKLHLLMN